MTAHVVHERAEPERVARHQDEPRVSGLDPQGAAVGGAQRERLLDHDVAAALDRLGGDLDVRAGVRRNDDGVDRAGGQRLAERRCRAGERVDTEERLAQVLAEVDERHDLDIGERCRGPDHLRAPVAAADERDAHLAGCCACHPPEHLGHLAARVRRSRRSRRSGGSTRSPSSPACQSRTAPRAAADRARRRRVGDRANPVERSRSAAIPRAGRAQHRPLRRQVLEDLARETLSPRPPARGMRSRARRPLHRGERLVVGQEAVDAKRRAQPERLGPFRRRCGTAHEPGLDHLAQLGPVRQERAERLEERARAAHAEEEPGVEDPQPVDGVCSRPANSSKSQPFEITAVGVPEGERARLLGDRLGDGREPRDAGERRRAIVSSTARLARRPAS
jgi:hypothetical protein